MNVVQELAARTLLVILAAAVVQDFMYMKISNRLILMGILFSLAFGLTTGGPKQVIYVLANLSFPVIVYICYISWEYLGRETSNYFPLSEDLQISDC